MRLKARTALISGAGRNMGKQIALTFAREGADLILVSRTGDELKKVAGECEALGVKALPLVADMGRHEDVNHVVQQGLARFGKVDVLVNALGLRPHKLPWDYGYEEWHQIFAINLHSSFYLTKALAPKMIERKSGSIIVLGGISSLTAQHGHSAAVVASKHGVYGLIKSLAHALGPHGVRANLLALGTTESERRNPEWYPEKGGSPQTPAKIANTPLGRLGKPQEVANVALFLASDDSSYITGDRISCTGGNYM